MSNNSPAPGRLDSLKGQRSGLTGAKPGSSLKFKPKVVARRSKEERDADAPIVVPESTQLPRSHSARGRGGARGRGRGGMDRHAGTHMVSSGPLSSGFVSMETKRPGPSRAGMSPSPTPEFIKNLRAKANAERASPSLSSKGSLSSDEEDGFVVDGDTKINMSKEYMFDESQTELFPVRAVRSDHRDYGEAEISIKQEIVIPKVTDEENTEIVVKAEQEDIVPKPEVESQVDPAGSEQLSQEKSRLAQDHERIHSLLSSSSSTRPSTVSSTTDVEGDVDMESKADESIAGNEEGKDGLFFFQLPKVLPEFKSKTVKAKEEKIVVEDVDDDKEEVTTKEEVIPDEPEQKTVGQIGKLRYHKSGKITMKLGKVIFDVSRGGNTDFLQDVIYIKNKTESGNEEGDLQDSEAEIYHLGEVLEKIVVTPKIDGSVI